MMRASAKLNICDQPKAVAMAAVEGSEVRNMFYDQDVVHSTVTSLVDRLTWLEAGVLPTKGQVTVEWLEAGFSPAEGLRQGGSPQQTGQDACCGPRWLPWCPRFAPRWREVGVFPTEGARCPVCAKMAQCWVSPEQGRVSSAESKRVRCASEVGESLAEVVCATKGRLEDASGGEVPPPFLCADSDSGLNLCGMRAVSMEEMLRLLTQTRPGEERDEDGRRDLS